MAEVDFSTEIWKPIQGYEGAYEVSSHGRARSLTRSSGCHKRFTRVIKGRVLVLTPDNGGYLMFGCCLHGRQRQVRISVCVLLTFVGPRPYGMQACHNNGTKTDNQLSNLRWDTPKGNAADRIVHGTNNSNRRRRRRSCTLKLTETDVFSIREMLASGIFQYVIAAQYGVDQTLISQIACRKIWKHI